MVLSQTVEETNIGDLITMTGTRELHTGIVVENMNALAMTVPWLFY